MPQSVKVMGQIPGCTGNENHMEEIEVARLVERIMCALGNGKTRCSKSLTE